MKNVVYMDRKELVEEVNRLRQWILDIGNSTPHKWLKKDAVRVLDNNNDS